MHRVLRVKVPLASARPAMIALRGVQGIVYQREGGSFAITLEPGDAKATARLVYQLHQLGVVDLEKLPKSVERAYEQLLRGEPQLLVGDGVGDDDSDEDVAPVGQANVARALVEHADPSSIF